MKWVLFGDPFPHLKCAATFETWSNPSLWESIEPQQQLAAAGEGGGTTMIRPHRGAIAWNPFRKRWVTVFTQNFGKPSMLGEIWYAEAKSPLGPWGEAVKVLSHPAYSFYNPVLHAGFTEDQPSVLLFEGTYTRTFSSAKVATPRHDYNQILYRLDLDDPALGPAQGE
jgi:hypothetical protein